MTRKFETDIKFTETWGNKLAKPSFYTTRGQDKLYKVGDIYPVTLVPGLFHRGDNYGPHRCFKIVFKRLCDYDASEIILDIGRRRALTSPRKAFYEIMKAFYHNKRWWDGKYTVMQKIYLEKL